MICDQSISVCKIWLNEWHTSHYKLLHPLCLSNRDFISKTGAARNHFLWQNHRWQRIRSCHFMYVKQLASINAASLIIFCQELNRFLCRLSFSDYWVNSAVCTEILTLTLTSSCVTQFDCKVPRQCLCDSITLINTLWMIIMSSNNNYNFHLSPTLPGDQHCTTNTVMHLAVTLLYMFRVFHA